MLPDFVGAALQQQSLCGCKRDHCYSIVIQGVSWCTLLKYKSEKRERSEGEGKKQKKDEKKGKVENIRGS